MTRRNSFFWLIAAAAVTYAALSPRFYVGSFGDDARDILAATSILHGSYSDLQQPSHPPLNLPLPGFPFLLAPFVALFGSAFGFLRIVPILFTVGSLFLLRKLFEPYFPSPGTLSVCLALFAFNPATLAYSTLVIADASYLFFIVWTLVLYSEDKTWLLSLVLTGAAFLRPEGSLLLLAVMMARIYERRWKAAFMSAPFPVIALSLWFLRNLRLTGQLSGYSPLWAEAFSFWHAGFSAWIFYAMKLGQKIFVDLIFGLSFSLSDVLHAGLAVVIVFLVIVVIVRGYRKIISAETAPRWVLVLSLYLCGHLLLHVLWPAADPHYLWPLLPFLLFYLVQGSPKSLWILLGALYLWQGGYALSAAFQKHPEEQLPKETLSWISTQTSQDSYFLAPNASTITLYTGRHALSLIRASGPRDFYVQLHQTGITHLLVLPPRFLYLEQAAGPSPEKAWWRIALTAAQTPAQYEQIYENPSEQSLVYRVKN